MTALSGLQFIRPHWLWALLALPLLVVWWRAARQRSGGWRDAVDSHLLPHLLEPTGQESRRRLLAGLAAFVLAVLALAGPSWRQGSEQLLQVKAPLVVVLELSSSIAAADLPPTRLARARAAVADLLQASQPGQAGLVVYAGSAHTVAPLTDDAANVALFLDALSPDIMPLDGSRADLGIVQARRLLAGAGFDRGDIVVVAHSADAAARRAAADAVDAGYRVSVLGLGTAAGGVFRADDGQLRRTRMDAAALAALAQAGSGRFSALESGAPVGVLLRSSGQADDAESGGRSIQVRKDEGYWLLLPLLVLAALAFRRNVLLILAVCALLPLPRTGSAAEAGLWRRDDQAAHARLQDGADAYRRGDFDAAQARWRGLAGADAAYNLGNALARSGRYQDAVDAYNRALKMEPGMEDAIANRDAVLAAMERRPPHGPGEGKPDRSGPGKRSPAPDQGETGGRDAGGEGTQPESGGGQPPSPPSPHPLPDDSAASPDDAEQAQDDADQAQREQMEKALQNQGGTEEGGQAAPESDPGERERREAGQAWLRRIPDDPGGLLRARFRLEYERHLREGTR